MSREPNVMVRTSQEAREVMVALDDMKFSAAHFVAFPGFREPVHGHNYSVAVRVGGALQADGYITDFGDLKKVARKACKKLNHATLIPMRSDVMNIEILEAAVPGASRQVVMRCEKGAVVTIPEVDCVLLPIVHTTAEEIAEHMWWDMLVEMKLSELLLARGVKWMEVSVSERPGQGAQYRNDIELVTLQESPFAQKAMASSSNDVSSAPMGLRPAPRRSFVPRPCFGREDSDEDATPPPPLPHPVAPLKKGLQLRQAFAGLARPAAEMSQQQPEAAQRRPPAGMPQQQSEAAPRRPVEVPQQQLEAVQLDASPEAVGEAAYRMLLSTLGPEESSRAELERTPYRAAKAFREMTAGLRVEDPLTAVGQGIFEVEEAQDLVAIRDIPFHSMCEHHLLPFSGMAHVAYFPRGKVLGLSKFPRLLEVYARRLQLHERLTAQYADGIEKLLQPRALAVALEATHGCMCHRGVGVNSSTRTLVVRGPGRQDPDTRRDLLEGVSFAGAHARARL